MSPRAIPSGALTQLCEELRAVTTGRPVMGASVSVMGEETTRRRSPKAPVGGPLPQLGAPGCFSSAYASNRGSDSVGRPARVEPFTVPVATYCGMPLAVLRGSETLRPTLGLVNGEIA